MLRVVVVGGTGFIGRSIVTKLVQAGDEVVVAARDPAAARRALDPRARAVAWTLVSGHERSEWERAVGEADAVVNLAGAGIMDAAWTVERKRELVASRVGVTEALSTALAAASANGGRPRALVSASAVGIYGMHTDDTLLDEESPHGPDFLATLCSRWEGAAAAARASGVRVVYPRLGIVLGRTGGALAAMARPFRFHAGGAIGSGRQWVSWVHEEDVASVIELAVRDSSLEGPFNVTAPHPVTMADEAKAIARALGTHAWAPVPAFVLRTILGKERAEAILTGQRVSSRRLEAAGFTFAFPELQPALDSLLADGARA